MRGPGGGHGWARIFPSRRQVILRSDERIRQITLARPVQSLESAAGAVGRGVPVPPFEEDIPTEFVSVVHAFERMARDVEASQDALESARRRTATVLSNVATGVVALDGAMRVARLLESEGEVFEMDLLFIPEVAPLREHPGFGPLLDALGITDYWRARGCTWTGKSAVCKKT